MNTTHRTARTTADVARAAAAFLALAALVAGIPAVLLLTGPPLPAHLPTAHQIGVALTRPDDGHLLLTALALAGWVGWAGFVLSLLVEVVARLLGRQTPRIPALAWAQRGTGVLVGAVLAVLPAGVAVAASHPVPPPTTATRLPPTVPAQVVSSASTRHALPPATRTYQVRPNDSLWRIAERELGDPRRYTEIAAANAGRDMGGGRRFDPEGFIHPGWILYLPDRPPEPTRYPAQPEHTVASGETLWEIAGDELGDPTRYPEIVELNRAKPQPDGHALTEPDLIRPGWHLTLPPTTTRQPPGPTRPTPATPRTPRPPGHPRQPSPPATVPTRASSATNTPAEPQRTVRHVAARPHHTNPALLPGVLLATGVAAALAAKRRLQQRRRRPGHRIAMSAAPSDSELAMRTQADPEHIALLDRALRSLSTQATATGQPLPPLAAARVTPATIELLLAEPAAPIPPFQAAGDLTWRIDQTSSALRAHHDLTGVPAAYPALVSIGHDDEGSLWLVDLEHTSPVHLVGDDTNVREVLTAIALELATSPFAERLHITCVGFGGELPHVFTSARLRYAPDVASALDALDPDLPERRNVLLSALPPTDEQHQRLAARALVVTASHEPPPSAEHVLDTAPNAKVVIHRSTPVTVQRLTNEEYQQFLVDLRTADEPDGPCGWTDVPPEPTDTSAVDAVPEPPSPEAAAENVPETGESDEAVDAHAPEIWVLGRVEIAGRDLADIEPGKRNLLCELAAYLVLYPGRSPDEVSRAMGGARAPWSPATRASNMSRLRAWFGKDAEGRNYVLAQGEGSLYTLRDTVRCDWHRFQDLARRGLADDPGGTAHLRAALDLVRGQPFANAGTRYIWAEYTKQDMISAIVDVAHTLAVRATKAGDPASARSAIARGLDVEPGSELLYRDLFRAEHRAGNIAGIAEAARRLTAINDQLGVDMEPDTADLLKRLLPNSHIAQSRAVLAAR